MIPNISSTLPKNRGGGNHSLKSALPIYQSHVEITKKKNKYE
jgi:hypothetical protein